MTDNQLPSYRPPKVSKELAGAAYDDYKRKAIDDAKKRAVGQRVDYDTFKNMVLTAHLKPITAPNKRSDDRLLPSWNFAPDGQVVKEQQAAQLPVQAPTEAPSSSGQFYRDWRTNCPTPDDKYRYIKLCGPAALRSLFKVEVNGEVLRELLAVLEGRWAAHAGAAVAAQGPGEARGDAEADGAPASGEDVEGEPEAGKESVEETAGAAEAAGRGCKGSGGEERTEEDGEGQGAEAALREAGFVVRVLEALTGAGRFALSVRLLGASGAAVLARLFASLEAAVAAEAAAGGAADGAQSGAPGSASGLCSAEQLSALKVLYGVRS